MTDWSCQKCRQGMFYDEERRLMVFCDCPAGQAKARWSDMSPEERERGRRGKMGRKKRKEREEVPF